MTADLIAVIPARGGSKRIERKNIVDFEGRPLIGWTIEAALESQCFERVLVSTDDAETADLARGFGAEVPDLRTAYADDDSPVSLATIDSLESLKAEGRLPRGVVQLFAVCPLRTAGDIRDAVGAFQRTGPPFQLSCYRWHGGHPFWSFTLAGDKTARPLFPTRRFDRSQDLPPVFVPTGAIWIALSDRLLADRTFYGPGHVFHEMPWQNAIDIDTSDDLEFARILHRARTGASQ